MFLTTFLDFTVQSLNFIEQFIS